ncbi:hypothetical protein X636_20900 [Pandoraea pnomenusa]|nr:hypothetical protein X636_20900 [Pandoraea pnomenusa]
MINKESALEILNPHLPRLEALFRDAWGMWLVNPVASRMQHRRVRANIVHNDALSLAKDRFDGGGSARYFEHGSWGGVMFDDRLFMRLKKGSSELKSSNVHTGATASFHDQDQDLFDGVARCELLYILNKDETDIGRIAVVHRHKKSIVWAIDTLGDSDVQSVIPFAPAPEGGGDGAVAKRLLKPKRIGENEDGKQRKSGNGGGGAG